MKRVEDKKKLSVIAAGIIPILSGDDTRHQYLFILNKETDIWEPPKGLLEGFETLFGCAKRECFEETGILVVPNNLINYQPEWVEYNVSDGAIKQILLFPCLLNKKPIVELSGEHCNYGWYNFEQLKIMHLKYRLPRNYLDVISRIETVSSQKHPLSLDIKEILSPLLSSGSFKKYSWYLTGSIAANEHTMHEEQLLSDIDLVAIGKSKPLPDTMYTHNALLGSLISENPIFKNVGIGCNYVQEGDSLDINTPFGSYFKDFAILLTQTRVRTVSFSTPEYRPTSSYDVFRAVWYACLRSNFLTAVSRNYMFLKSYLLIYHLTERTGKSFSYVQFRAEVSESIHRATQTEEERELMNLLTGLNYKLNLSKSAIDINWEYLFYQNAINLSTDLIGHEGLFARFVLKIDQQGMVGENKWMELIKELNGSNSFLSVLQFVDYQTSKELTWVLLICLRIQIWPYETRNSVFKYLHNIEILFQSAPEYTNTGTRSLIKKLVDGCISSVSQPKSNKLRNNDYLTESEYTNASRTL